MKIQLQIKSKNRITLDSRIREFFNSRDADSERLECLFVSTGTETPEGPSFDYEGDTVFLYSVPDALKLLREPYDDDLMLHPYFREAIIDNNGRIQLNELELKIAASKEVMAARYDKIKPYVALKKR